MLLIAAPFRLVAKWKHARATHQTGGKWFFSIWPITFLDDRGTDRIYGPLDDGASQIVSLFADGIHQTASMIRYLQFKQLQATDGSVVLEDHLCWSDLWCLLTGVFKAFAGLGLKAGDRNSALNMLFHEEDLASRFRAPRLLLFYRLFRRFVRRQRPQELHYHLFEYPLGKIISFVAESHDCWRVGYQHGPAAEMKLLCRDGSGDSRLHPNVILVEDDASCTIYAKGWPTKVVVRDQVPRLRYLEGVSRKHVSDTVLFALPQHNYLSLVFLANKLAVSSAHQILIKPHPRSSFNVKTIALAPKIEVTAEPIAVLYESVGFIFSTYSSSFTRRSSWAYLARSSPSTGLVDMGVSNGKQ